MDFKGKKILVTGGTRGIGRAAVEAFLRAGARVAVNGSSEASVAKALTALGAGDRAVAAPGNLGLVADCQRVVEGAIARLQGLDVLVNNAGIGGGGAIEEVPVDFARSMFETNYLGVVRMVQAVLPGMRQRRRGAIVNISSIGGRVAIAGHGHYCAIKHALEAASEALAQEVQGHGIRVAIVEPGVVITPIFQKAKRFSDPAGPYAEHVRRLLLFYQLQMKVASQPEDAARIVFEAATTDTPRLRWLVGEDAKRLDAGRRRITDEEHIAGARPMPDAQYVDEMKRRFGFDWS
jgi:NAD(P)-dependent dehydrogenase (short-subunit alcohol dehydrogenase family)